MKKITYLLIVISMLSLQKCTTPKSSETPFAQPPAWAKHAIWYQIFVERFYNGDKTNDPKPENIKNDTSYIVPNDWALTKWEQNWYALSAWEQNLAEKKKMNFNSLLQLRRYGGDLQGVIDKLDYLCDLGINALYINPINDAPSLHKYDARNYHHIDVNFGPDPVGDNKIIAAENPADPTTWKWTSADKLFLKLVDEAHKRGIKVVVDYSWNHTGTEFWAFRDVVKNQEKSLFKDWYDIILWNNPAQKQKFDYVGWAGVRSLPELKKVNITTKRVSGYPYEGDINAGAKKHIFDVTRRWLAPDGDTAKGIDGYRLDVADQIPMGFWRDYRNFVRSVKSDAYLVGEIWWTKWPDVLMNPKPYCSGDVFDAVMFYQIYRPARSFFAKTDFAIDAKRFGDSLNFQWSRLAEPFRYSMMNVNATHDSPRLLTCFGNSGKYKFNANPAADAQYKTCKPDAETYQRVKLYLIHQFTNIGAPQIWNGDEMGMWGADDPDCRKPLWWKEFQFEPETRNNFQKGTTAYDTVSFNQEHFDFYKKIVHIRKNNPVLSTGAIEFLKTDDKVLVYKRFDSENQIVVYFNLDAQNHDIDLPENGNYLNLLDNTNINGKVISLNPLSALILKKVK